VPVDCNVAGCLWFAAGLAALVVCLPMVLGMVGCTRFGVRVVPSAAACAPAGEGEEYLFYHRQVQALGFAPLGVIETRNYCFGFHYVKRCRYRVFAHRELGVYASIYQLFPGDEFRVSLSTLLTDGWLVQTLCQASLDGAGEKYHRGGITTRVVAEQLKAHQDWLRSCWEEGDTVAPIGLSRLAERMHEVNKSFGGWFRAEAVQPLVLALVVLGGSAALGWLVPAWRLWSVPSGLLVGSLVYRPLMTFLLGWAAQGMRRDGLDKQLHAAGGLDCWSGSEMAPAEGSRSEKLKA
jgi:hypothetical protein